MPKRESATVSYYICQGLMRDLDAYLQARLLPMLMHAYQLGIDFGEGNPDMVVPHTWNAIGPQATGEQWVCEGCRIEVKTDGQRPLGGECKTIPLFDLVADWVETGRKLRDAEAEVARLRAQTNESLQAQVRAAELQRDEYKSLLDNATAKYSEEAFLHAACLSIAEGAPGWHIPVKGEGPAQQAVRKVRALANVLEKVFPSTPQELHAAVDRVNDDDVVLCEGEWRELVDFVTRVARMHNVIEVAVPQGGNESKK